MSAPAVATTARTPDVLALPSATTMRFVLLAAAMLVVGLFVGVTVFGAVEGQTFQTAVLSCGGNATCLAPIEHRYALFALGGAAAVAIGALVVVLAAPAVIIRRRRLRDPGVVGAAALARLTAFCADAGIRRPPRLLAGSAALRDAFCLGRPGRYAVAIPLPLLIRPHTPLFEAALRHELAHVRGHDVAVSWLARAVWYALAPLLLLPVVLFSLTGDLALLPGYLWRAALIAAVVTLARQSALRSRELSADVTAANLAGAAAVADALNRLRASATA